MMKQLLLDEFERRVFSESYSRIFKCLALIPEEKLWFSPNGNIPSVGNLVLHLCGNGRQWILSGLGGKPDNRDRAQEFMKHSNIRKSDLIFLMENFKSNARQVFKTLVESDLAMPRTIQGFHETGLSALIHVIEHFSYHTGQITTLTKLICDVDTGYYSGKDLNAPNFN